MQDLVDAVAVAFPLPSLIHSPSSHMPRLHPSEPIQDQRLSADAARPIGACHANPYPLLQSGGVGAEDKAEDCVNELHFRRASTTSRARQSVGMTFRCGMPHLHHSNWLEFNSSSSFQLDCIPLLVLVVGVESPPEVCDIEAAA